MSRCLIRDRRLYTYSVLPTPFCVVFVKPGSPPLTSSSLILQSQPVSDSNIISNGGSGSPHRRVQQHTLRL